MLAALGIATVTGVPMDSAIEKLATVEPLSRRMSVETTPDGVVFVRDDFKAPSDSFVETLRFLEAAEADRKYAIFGTISDHPGRSRPVYTEIAGAAMQVVDELVLVGERAHRLWRAGATPWSDPSAGSGNRARVRVIPTVQEAAGELGPELAAGDLVLLKGSGPADHLERILLDRTTGVRCWLTSCGRVLACDDCERCAA